MDETLIQMLLKEMQDDYEARIKELHPLNYDLYEPKNQMIPVKFDGIYKKLTSLSQSELPAGQQ